MAFQLGVKQFNIIKSTDITSNVLVMSHEVKDDGFVPADVEKSDQFNTDALTNGLFESNFPITEGVTTKDSDVEQWCISEGYNLFENGLEVPGVFAIETAVASAAGAAPDNIDITFAKDIALPVDAATTKAAMTISVNGAAFVAFAAGDVVSITGNNNVNITILAELTATDILIVKFAAGALEDTAGTPNSNLAITTKEIVVAA